MTILRYLLLISSLCAFFMSVFFWYQPELLSDPQHITADHGDSILNYYFLSHSLNILSSLDLSNFWNGHIFYPFSKIAALSDTLLFQSLLILPFDLFNIDRFFLFNCLPLVFFILMGVLSFILFNQISNRFLVSLYASTIATVHLYWFGHLAHFQLLTTFWYPLIALFFLFYDRTRSILYWYLCCLSLLGLLLSSPYLFILYSLPFSILCMIFLYVRRPKRSELLKLGIPITLWILAASLFIYPYLKVKSWYGMVRSDTERLLYSASWESFSNRGGLDLLSPILGSTNQWNSERDIYIALFTRLALLFVAMIWLIQSTNYRTNFISGRRHFGLLSLSLSLTVLSVFIALGPGDTTLGPFNIWSILNYVPGMSGVRVPARSGFLIFFLIGTSIAIGLSQIKHRSIPIILALLIPIHIAEMKPANQYKAIAPVDKVSSISNFIKDNDISGSTLMLPVREKIPEILMLASLGKIHFINGRSGYTPDILEEFIFPILEGCPSSLCMNLLSDLKVNMVLLDNGPQSNDMKISLSKSNANILYEDQYYTLIRIKDQTSLKFLGNKQYLEHFQVPKEPHCETIKLSSKSQPNDVEYASDGDLNTRWTSQREQGKNTTAIFELNKPEIGPFTLKLLTDTDEVLKSDFIRNPKVSVYTANHQEIQSSFRGQIGYENGSIVQWFKIIPEGNHNPVSRIRIIAQDAIWSENWWSISEAFSCHFQNVQASPEKPYHKI